VEEQPRKANRHRTQEKDLKRFPPARALAYRGHRASDKQTKRDEARTAEIVKDARRSK
jgi:hypothetical protein